MAALYGSAGDRTGLVESVDRARAKRVFVVCSPSVNNRTDIVRRIEAELGERYAGVFDGIEKDSTYRSVVAAKEAAEEAGADLLIGAGGGSVLVATRVVAVYMGEDADPFEIMTQYPEGKPAYSPRLMAPKPPIFNIHDPDQRNEPRWVRAKRIRIWITGWNISIQRRARSRFSLMTMLC